MEAAGEGRLDGLLKDGSTEAVKEYLKELSSGTTNPTTTRDICALIRRVVSDEVNIGMAREITTCFAEDLLKTLPPAVIKTIAVPALDLLQPRLHSFETQANQVREVLSGVYLDEEDYDSAAHVLEGIATDEQSSTISDAKKLEINVKIAQIYLEIDKHTQAETFINRATRLLPRSGGDKTLELLYKACRVRLDDRKRKYVVAAQRYYELSLESIVDFEERMTSLTCSLNCAVLAPAGVTRSRLLTKLFMDERARNLAFYSLLERMHRGQIVRRGQIEAFEGQLEHHHKATLQDGVTTIVDRAMREHNIVSASKIYRNICFKELGALLGVGATEAESMTADMIAEDRLAGRIDQLANFVHFDGYDVSASWDDRIRAICIEANLISSKCQQKLNSTTAQAV